MVRDNLNCTQDVINILIQADLGSQSATLNSPSYDVDMKYIIPSIHSMLFRNVSDGFAEGTVTLKLEA